MNTNRLILLRVIETLFIIINAVAIKSMNIGSSIAYKLTFNLSLISIDPCAAEVSINTAVIGYLLSALGSIYCYSLTKLSLYKVSLVLSALGILSFILEVIRFFSMQHFQIVLQAGILLIIIDWYCFFRYPERILRGQNSPGSLSGT